MTRLAGLARDVIQEVHARPGLSRVEAARRLGIGTGALTRIVATLVETGLLSEEPAAPSGGRGRPTTVLLPHPHGPLVVAAAIAHESWRVEVVELGGRVLASTDGVPPGRDPASILGDVRHAITLLRRRFPRRVRAGGVSVPGTVLDRRTVDASYLGWHDVDLRALWPRAPALVAGNDATLAGLAEVRRGIAGAARCVLHLQVEAGVGGAVIERGRVLGGARDTAGEFGHLPLGDPQVRCPCGAYGCWGTAVDGTALARALGARQPVDPVAYARRVLSSDRPDEVAAVRLVAAELGRGAAGLVNGLDADLVVLGGLGVDLLAAARTEAERAYRRGLMAVRRYDPPPLVAASLAGRGSIVGAAEEAWTRLWPLLQV